VAKVKEVLDGLGDEFDLVALDRFLKLAAGNPTFEYPTYLDPEHVPAKMYRRPRSTGLPPSDTSALDQEQVAPQR